MSGPALRAACAAVVYLAISLWLARPVLSDPRGSVLFPVGAARRAMGAMVESDQGFVTGTLVRNARLLWREPGAVLGYGSCYPLWQSFTLGEHLFGESLLGALPWAVTRDPIATTNAVTVLSWWIAALAMYALVVHFTDSSGAGFIAGLLFAFHPARLGDPVHPMVHGNLWVPLALLFAHRLFRDRRWRDAFGLALVVGLSLLESFYQVLGLAILGGVYGIALLVHHRRSLLSLLPKLLPLAAAALLIVVLVLLPYLRARSAWQVFGGRDFVLMFAFSDYAPGGYASFGWLPLGLAALGTLDRLRGPRGAPGDDPRLALLAGGFLVLWCSVYAIVVPGTAFRLESPARVLAGLIPGLDAVRVLRAVRFNVYLVVALLAGYGVVALAAASGSARRAVIGAIALAALAEMFSPPLATAGYGAPTELMARAIAPQPAERDLYRQMPPGAVLDLPFHYDLRGRLTTMARYVFLGAYHGRPVAACYNSFATPLQDDVERRARRLPDRAAEEELAALGFGAIVVHGDLLLPEDRARLAPFIAEVDAQRVIAQAGDVAIHSLAASRRSIVGLEALAAGAAGEGAVAAAGIAGLNPVDAAGGLPDAQRLPEGATRQDSLPPSPAPAPQGSASPSPVPRVAVGFKFYNPTEATYRHPDPIEPTLLVVRWRDQAGTVKQSETVRALLPIAIAAGGSEERTIELAPPSAAGEYVVELAPATAPDQVLSRTSVWIGPSSRN